MNDLELQKAWMELLIKYELEGNKPVYDFGWNLVHISEPNDERRINR